MAKHTTRKPAAPRRAKAVKPASARPAKSDSTVKHVSLALQGGGAHGAFTWGVLDRLLEDERLAFDGISGTSAGAMNGAVMVQGFTEGGREGARASLERFWRRISEAGRLNPVQRSLFDRATGNWNLDSSPAYLFLDSMSRLLSPYQTNPSNYHPLRPILDETIDFDRLHERHDMNLFVCATNVRTGKVKIFDCEHLTADALLASACLPTMFQAIEIDGEAYWDGGYMGNPALFPLIYKCASSDLVIVQINPIKRAELPRTASEILNRVNEISFNSTLNREIRAIAFVRKLIDEENLDTEKYRRLNLHMIESEDCMSQLGVSSKANADWEFLAHLKEIGRAAADDWLGRNFDRIGHETTVDLFDKFL
ncbi:MAG: patatin-like phospholipase family protein [Alphaproteobacteria bacterium]